MATMRALLGGLIGGFLAVLLVLALVAAVRARAGQDRRAVLLREIGEYEREFPPPSCVGSLGYPTERTVADFVVFRARHEAFDAYWRWWVRTRRREGASLVDEFTTTRACADDLRQPRYLDAYLAGR
jgi:hypothetical protein